jgi:hypothetical protein
MKTLILCPNSLPPSLTPLVPLHTQLPIQHPFHPNQIRPQNRLAPLPPVRNEDRCILDPELDHRGCLRGELHLVELDPLVVGIFWGGSEVLNLRRGAPADGVRGGGDVDEDDGAGGGGGAGEGVGVGLGGCYLGEWRGRGGHGHGVGGCLGFGGVMSGLSGDICIMSDLLTARRALVEAIVVGW